LSIIIIAVFLSFYPSHSISFDSFKHLDSPSSSSIGGFSAGVSPAGLSFSNGSHQGFFLHIFKSESESRIATAARLHFQRRECWNWKRLEDSISRRFYFLYFSKDLLHTYLASLYKGHIAPSQIIIILRSKSNNADLLAIFILAKISVSMNHEDESRTHAIGVVSLLNVLCWKERNLGQSSWFAKLRPYFKIVLTDFAIPLPLLVQPATQDELAIFANIVHNHPLEYDIFCDRYTAYDYAVWRNVSSLLAALGSPQGLEVSWLADMVATISADFQHIRFHPIIKTINQLLVTSSNLSASMCLRCFRYLEVCLLLQICPNFGTFRAAFESDQTRAHAWRLVRFISTQKALLYCTPPLSKRISFALFLGSCFFPPSETRDSHIFPIALK